MLNFFEWNESEQKAIRTFGALGQLADLACGQLAEQQTGTVPEAAKPLREGLSGFLWKAGKVLSTVSLALALAPG